VVDFRDLIDRLRDDRNRFIRYLVLAGVVVVTVSMAVLIWYSLPGRSESNPVPVELPKGFAVRSAAFRDRGMIPAFYTVDGRNYSPPLDFLNIPTGAVELALTMHEEVDEETPPRVHWILYKIDLEVGAIPEAIERAEVPSAPLGSMQGANHWGEVGYRGPMPDPGAGASRYVFTLYALSEPLDVELPNPRRRPRPNEEELTPLTHDELLALMEGKIIEQTTFVGRYKR